MERPILFSTPMVQAIQNGRKKQTRRTRGLEEINKNPHSYRYIRKWVYCSDDGLKRKTWVEFKNVETGEMVAIPCPYGVGGDVLWVRETFAVDRYGVCRYKAVPLPEDSLEVKWKPSIHMKRVDARLFLYIMDIRVEQLQSVSDGDALLEGIEALTKDGKLLKFGLDGWDWSFMERSPKGGFFLLWCTINGQESWEANPWVWVITFKKLN